MITAASLKSHTSKDLAQMARKKGVAGWHSMRKDELIKALVKLAKKNATKGKKKTAVAKTTRTDSAKTSVTRSARGAKKVATTAKRSSQSVSAKVSKAKSAKSAKKTTRSRKVEEPPRVPTNPRVARKIRRLRNEQEDAKDLAAVPHEHFRAALPFDKDRVVLLVRDAFWLQAYWEITRQTIERAKVALAEHWHAAIPVLRLVEVEAGSTTNASEKVVRDIEIHGGVKNWYIDVADESKSYRIRIGYKAANGRFQCLASSNSVDSPSPGSADAIDRNWTDIAKNGEKVFAMSGGYDVDGDQGDLRELFEERLRRPMGSPVVTQYGIGAEATMDRKREFKFNVDAEMIIYGTTSPNAYVTLAGEPVKLREDGSFTVRMSLPDRRQVLPVVASSSDGVEQRTTVLAIERNTKVMETVVRETVV